MGSVRYNTHQLGETISQRRGKLMIKQTILPFKLKRTKEEITARSGLAIYGELMKAYQVDKLVSKYLPKPGSGAGIAAINYVRPLSMTLYGGGERIEHTREVRDDKALRVMLGMDIFPSVSAMGDWLVRMGFGGGIEGLEKVNDAITRKILRQDKRQVYTLIIDPTIIEADKRNAQMTYAGVKGYRPVVVTIKELGLTIAYQFKEGNDNGGKLEIVQKAFMKMPKNKKIKEVLLDAEYYCNEVMDSLNECGVSWAIGADKDEAVMKAIESIPQSDWQAYQTKDGITTDREIAETVHCTNKGKKAFRLIVLRWQDKQLKLFKNIYHYHCIAANFEQVVSAQEVVWHYNQRCHIENHIKELKGGFGMQRMPCGEFVGNAVWFGIGVMSYNLFIAQKLFTLPEGWQNKTIKSVRWLLVEVAGKWVEHGRQVILKLAVGKKKFELYLQMRRRIYALSLE
jgi:hypothetical protein